MGVALGDDRDAYPPPVVAASVRTFAQAMQTLGKAQLGDKTMLDALLPFVDAFEANLAAGSTQAQAWRDASVTAEAAAQATAELRPKVGRARPLAERSVGTPDPGAVSMAMCLRVIGAMLRS